MTSRRGRPTSSRPCAKRSRCPLAIKLTPVSQFARSFRARRCPSSGAAGLVLFNRLLEPDIDLVRMRLTDRLGSQHARRDAAADAVDRDPVGPRQGVAGGLRRRGRRHRCGEISARGRRCRDDRLGVAALRYRIHHRAGRRPAAAGWRNARSPRSTTCAE